MKGSGIIALGVETGGPSDDYDESDYEPNYGPADKE